MQKLSDCAAGGGLGEESGGWVFADGWAVIAEDEETAQQVADAADDGTLADDETYQQWMGEVGDAGIASAYVAPAAGEFIADALQDPGPGVRVEHPLPHHRATPRRPTRWPRRPTRRCATSGASR